MADIETQRQANIKRNQEHLKQLGILYTPPATNRDVPKRPPAKKRKLEARLRPSRVSARIASAPTKTTYDDRQDDDDDDDKPKGRSSRKKTSRPVIKKSKAPPTEPEVVATIPAKDIEEIRAGWTTWSPSAPSPTRDDDSTFHFEGQPTFTPNKSPEEMLREGCFGGSYFRPLRSRKLGITVSGDYLELPSSWISGLDIETFLTSPTYDPEVNKYKVSSGQTIEEWEAAGWINHTYDVRGWFQWYCRFYMGRRCDDDGRQISRWRKCVGETGRWRRILLKKYVAMGIREVFDDGEDEEQNDVSPVMHQTCHHWA